MGQATGEATTLEALLRRSLHQFEQMDYVGAAQSFDELVRVFGREPEYTAAATQRVVLPLHGYAKLANGETAEALSLFEAYLEQFPGRSRREAFVLFAYGGALQREERWQDARVTYQRFAGFYGDTPEAAIAQLRIGETYVEEGRIEEALDELDRFYLAPHAHSLKLQARLRTLQLALEADLHERAAGTLLETDWEVEDMPELAILAFAALRIGDYLMQAERPAEAIEAYRLVPGHARLHAGQTEQMERIRATMRHRASFFAGRGSAVWTDYYRSLLARLEALQKQLEAMPDYTGSHLLRYGQAFASAGRHFEAWVVFATAAEDAELLSTERQEAHYRWIVAAQSLERWGDALAIARVYVDRYPRSPQAPLVLFLLANAHQQLGALPEAEAILDELLATYPEHRLRGRWLFTRGFNHVLRQAYGAARADLAHYVEAFPDGPLRLNAQLWHALAWFFEKAHAPALRELNALLAVTPRDHYLRPEMAYRRASVLYAQREYAPALTQIEAYLTSYPEDRNGPQARVLRGDILMGLGRLEEAAGAFASVPPEAGALFAYAIFQGGKIHRALEAPGEMARHFEAYLARRDLSPHPRRAEALYWIGWARQQENRPHLALVPYLQGVERFGNELSESGMPAILGGLHALHGALQDAAPELPERAAAFLRAPDFLAWLIETAEAARARGALTAYARLRLYEAERRAEAGQSAAAEALRLEVAREVPLEAMDANGLATTARALEGRGERAAREAYEALLRRFPRAPERVTAWLGLGRGARAAGDFEAAAAWLARARDWLTHPDAPEAVLIHAEVLLELERPAELGALLEPLLRLKSARGRPHARALLLLARGEEAQGRSDRAIPIFQRVFNLYRGYPDLVSEAYARSAELFEQRGDLPAARDTWREVIFFEELIEPALRMRARAELARLEALVPRELTDHPEDSAS